LSFERRAAGDWPGRQTVKWLGSSRPGISKVLINSDEHLSGRCYHAQPRHCLQRISSPDHGQLRAPVFEPAGCGIRLDKRPLRLRVFDAGTIRSRPEPACPTNRWRTRCGRCRRALRTIPHPPSPVPLTESPYSQAALVTHPIADRRHVSISELIGPLVAEFLPK
jgi:hypothetical protein